MSQTDNDRDAVTARAHSNIALIKYWGKRDARLNLPAVGSISITLDGLYTDTTVKFVESLAADELVLDNAPADAGRVTRFLDIVRDGAGLDTRARIESHNNFPTGAGLASSASGFAALALAATKAAGLTLDQRTLSILARQGSGSAARSIFGGFAEMYRGNSDDGLDAFADPLLDAHAWPLEVVVAITEHGTKTIDSTDGMNSSAQRSDFFASWIEHADADLHAMRRAIDTRHFAALGELAEHSCLKMHALMLSTRPGLIYWNAATMATMHAIRALRADGLPVYFTIDAGPQVKAICAPGAGAEVADALARVPGVLETRQVGLGPAAFLSA